MQGDGRRRWRDVRKKGTMCRRGEKTILDSKRTRRKTVRFVVIRASVKRMWSQIIGKEDAFDALFHICKCCAQY